MEEREMDRNFLPERWSRRKIFMAVLYRGRGNPNNDWRRRLWRTYDTRAGNPGKFRDLNSYTI